MNELTINFSRESGLSGHWLPAWRLNTPGHGFAQDRVGGAYQQFLLFWRGVAIAIDSWNRNGRPAPATFTRI